MLTATLGKPGMPLSILCLGAHSDDIEIGCGGTMLRLLAEHPGSTVHWVVFAASSDRAAEARSSAAAMVAQAGKSTVQVHGFRDSFFPYVGEAIKTEFEKLKSAVAPELIFTHRTRDAHQDHRTIAELTWNTFRDHLIAEYEIAKYEGDLGHPNVFVPIDDAVAKQKINHLMRYFPSQVDRRWFRPETFEALLRLRGMECAAPEGLAEAFHVRKLTL